MRSARLAGGLILEGLGIDESIRMKVVPHGDEGYVSEIQATLWCVSTEGYWEYLSHSSNVPFESICPVRIAHPRRNQSPPPHTVYLLPMSKLS